MEEHIDAPAPAQEVVRVHRDCPICCATINGSVEVDYGRPDWPLLRCAGCGLLYLSQVPVYGELAGNISWTNQHSREQDRRSAQSPILAKLDLMTRWRLGIFGEATPAGGLVKWAKPGHVLDVGCATGKAFDALPANYIPNGIEIDVAASRLARERFEPRGGTLINADGVSGLLRFPSGHFTGVSLWSYLEHEARPREALENVRRVIGTGGVVLVKVPNFDCWNRVVLQAKWPGFRAPDHVQYFTPATLERLANDTGFDVRFRLYGRIPLNDNMYAILRPREGRPSG